MQREAQAVSDWAEENGMELNLKKSKVMLLGSKVYITSNIPIVSNLLPIQMNINPLQYVNLFKNLGLWINPTLDWKAHVKHILKYVHSFLGSLYFYQKSLSFSLKNFYCPSSFHTLTTHLEPSLISIKHEFHNFK